MCPDVSQMCISSSVLSPELQIHQACQAASSCWKPLTRFMILLLTSPLPTPAPWPCLFQHLPKHSRLLLIPLIPSSAKSIGNNFKVALESVSLFPTPPWPKSLLLSLPRLFPHGPPHCSTLPYFFSTQQPACFFKTANYIMSLSKHLRM